MDPARITVAHSPDSDDAFMFYALATRKIRSPLVDFEHVLADIETLNEAALTGRHEMTAISYHAYAYVADKYVLTPVGSSVGDGYGPIVIAPHPCGPEELKGKTIAVPGLKTTAYLALKLLEPDFHPLVLPFDRIVEAVQQGSADAGLIIHEGQISFDRLGVHRVVDLGRWWKQAYGLPLPLGANAILRSLPTEVSRECCRMLRKSIEFAMENRAEALAYAGHFARGMDAGLTDKFVSMYVNHHTLDGDGAVLEAAQKLLEMGYQAGVIPGPVTVELMPAADEFENLRI